jgi:arylsulfatase A-like enzyme
MTPCSRRSFLSALTIGSASLLPLGSAQRTKPPKKPNIVFFLIDDLGWKDIGAYGSTFYETPNVDSLAKAGMTFTDGYATCPVCSPSRVSILSGKYPARLDTTNYFGGRRKGKLIPAPYLDRLPLEEVTLAEAMNEQGYKTFFAGKWHLGDEKFFPEEQGFDINKGGQRGGGPPGGYFSPYKNSRLSNGPDGECLPDRLGDESIKFIQENQDNPFLLYLSFYSVHTPLQTKETYQEKYKEKSTKVLVDEEFKQVTPQRRHQARQAQKHPVYAGMIQSMDENIGKVLKKLDALGLSDNTIICFTSDNGGLSTSEGRPTSNLPLKAGKGWLYEGGVRVPYIIKWPGVTQPGSTCTTPVTGTDFYPTLLEATGCPLKPQQHVDGTSLVPLLNGDAKNFDRQAIYWHYPHYGNQGGLPGSAIRSGDYKLIEHFEDNSLELYHLKDDIGEHVDLSKKLPEKTAELKELLYSWRKNVDAKMMSQKED